MVTMMTMFIIGYWYYGDAKNSNGNDDIDNNDGSNDNYDDSNGNNGRDNDCDDNSNDNHDK